MYRGQRRLRTLLLGVSGGTEGLAEVVEGVLELVELLGGDVLGEAAEERRHQGGGRKN